MDATLITNNLTLYVYYKMPVSHSASSVQLVKQLQQSIALYYPEVVIQQQKRPHPDATDHETWMEVYAGISQLQIEKLIADLSDLATTHGLPYERKYEVFLSL